MAKNSELSTVYCAYGDDALKRRTAIERLLTRLSAFGDVTLNTSVFAAPSTSVGDIIAACQTAPFFSEYRLVRVTDADKLSKADTESLCAYIANANPTTVLYLEAEKLSPSSLLAKAVKSANAKGLIDCAIVSNKELPRLVAQMASRYGISLDQEAIEVLIDSVGNDTILLDNTLKKLSLLHDGSASITVSDVRDSVSQVAEAKPWGLLDALSARNLDQALENLHHLNSETPLGLLSLATGRVRDLIAAKTFDERGEADKLPDVIKRQEWLAKKYVKWARGYTQAELADALIRAAQCEADMKRGVENIQALEDWLITTITR